LGWAPLVCSDAAAFAEEQVRWLPAVQPPLRSQQQLEQWHPDQLLLPLLTAWQQPAAACHLLGRHCWQSGVKAQSAQHQSAAYHPAWLAPFLPELAVMALLVTPWLLLRCLLQPAAVF
jgi:hypothetical protein